MNAQLQKENRRLEALRHYEALDASADPGLDELVALAADICDTPIAGISLIDATTVHFIARYGPGPRRQPRGRVPCELCLRGNGLLEIKDARYSNEFRPDGITMGGRTFRFYAGAPLVSASGVNLGCLFVQDSIPHALNERQKAALMTLSRQVMTRLELNNRQRNLDRDGRVRQRVESALTVERNFVTTVLDTVGALVAVYDTAGRIVRFNRTCEEVSGHDFPSLVGRYFWEKLIPATEVPAAIANFERLRSGKFPASFEDHWQHRDGGLRRIAWSATALVDPQGNTNYIIATGIDVTQQRQAEETLRESESRYRELVESSLGMVCTHDLEGNLLSVNQHGAISLGYSVDDMTGHSLREYIAPEFSARLESYLVQIGRAGEARGRLHLRHRDGEVRVVAYRNRLVHATGREPCVLGFGVDITEQVRAEEKLRALMGQSESILESVGDGIYGIDLDGRVTVVNPAAAAMLGYTADELLGRKMHELILHTRADGTHYPVAECNICNAVTSPETRRSAADIFWRKDGTSFPVQWVATPQIERSDRAEDGSGETAGRVIGVVVAFTDTTERQALDRMKDEFISTVSHELRTPLTSLRAALGLVRGGTLVSRPEKAEKMLQIAIDNTDRLSRLVNDILELERVGSGRSELHASVCSVQSLLERAASLQRVAAMKNRLHVVVDGGGTEVWADFDRILQTMTKLLMNAIQFSPPGGIVRMRAMPSDDSSMTEITVEDHGPGIAPELLHRIFERFSQGDGSDSRRKGGTGLGLAICRSIVTQHGGRIWATNNPGGGACLHVALPVRRPARLL